MLAVSIIVLVLIFDQISKYLVIQNIMGNQDLVVIKNFLSFTYVENTGIAFGMFKNNTLFFIVLTSIIALVVLYFLIKFYKKNLWITVLLSVVFSGAVGNIIDRIRFGYVVDFVHFSFFPAIFNIADSAVVVGAIALSLLILLDKNIDL